MPESPAAGAPGSAEAAGEGVDRPAGVSVSDDVGPAVAPSPEVVGEPPPGDGSGVAVGFPVAGAGVAVAGRSNRALVAWSAVIERKHVVPCPAQAPVQPSNTELPAGATESPTTVPYGSCVIHGNATHGDESTPTDPLPVPLVVTVSVDDPVVVAVAGAATVTVTVPQFSVEQSDTAAAGSAVD